MDRDKPVLTPAQEALIHLRNAAVWLSAAAVSDPLLADRAARVTTEAETLAAYVAESGAPAVVTLGAGIDRIFRRG